MKNKKIKITALLKITGVILFIWFVFASGAKHEISKRKRHAVNRKDYQIKSTHDKWMSKRNHNIFRLVLGRIQESINE